MRITPSDDQLAFVEALSKILTKLSTLELIRALPGHGFDSVLWSALAEAGLPMLRVPEDRGGLGASLLDAVLVAEEAGRLLASVPVAELIVVARTLALVGDAAADRLAAVLDGSVLVTLALNCVERGAAQLVNGGAVATAVIGYDGEALRVWDLNAPPPLADNLGLMPLAMLDLAEAPSSVLAEGDTAAGLFGAMVSEWRLLAAAQMGGMAAQSLIEAAAYSRERHAFGQPIGTFQGLAHPLSDAITDVDGGMQFLRLAAWSLAERQDGGAAMIPLAFWWTARAAQAATLKAMRVFGGYGVSLEYPAPIFYRRARTLALLAGSLDAQLDAAAEDLLDRRATVIPDAGDVGVDYGYGAVADRFAEEARTFFRAHMTPELEAFAYATTDGFHPIFSPALYENGFWFADWPEEVGGQGRGPLEMSALSRVYGEFDWWITVPNISDMVAKIIIRFGSDEAKAELLPKARKGEIIFSLGYSEPSAGSDIFAARTTAVADGDEWIINGQKMFTSQGHIATHALMLCRTDSSLAKHAGITLFIVPLDQPGYSSTPIETLGGELTNVTFYSDVRTPDTYRLGAVNGGAKVLGYALSLEQSGGDFFLIPLRRIYRDMLAWARADAGKRLGRAEVRRALARLQAYIHVLDALNRRALGAHAEGSPQKHYGPMTKLFGSEAVVSVTNEILDVAAPVSLLESNTPLGRVLVEARRSVAATIYAGTSEVQRSIIGESALGMPRTRS